jgi:hypothetical protein
VSQFQKILAMTSSSSKGHVLLQAEGLTSRNARIGPSEVLSNIVTALRIFFALPASLASGERAFAVLKQVKGITVQP